MFIICWLTPIGLLNTIVTINTLLEFSNSTAQKENLKNAFCIWSELFITNLQFQ